MLVLVDTSVWSLALRKKTLSPDQERMVGELVELIKELRVILIGPIRQELLSGISNDLVFHKLKDKLNAFDDTVLDTADYIRAAEISNTCRKHGVQGSYTDFLLCSVASNHGFAIFTTDQDFTHFKECVDIKLHIVREG